METLKDIKRVRLISHETFGSDTNYWLYREAGRAWIRVETEFEQPFKGPHVSELTPNQWDIETGGQNLKSLAEAKLKEIDSN